MANWEEEALPTLRVLIQDWDDEPEYDDSRLTQLLLTAAKLNLLDMSFDSDYTISMLNLTISPDPLAEEDDTFINLMVLRAACLCDIGTFKKKAALDGLKAALGPVNLSVAGHAAGFKSLIELGVCKTFIEAKKQFLFGNKDFARGVFSPFVSNDFDPQYLKYFYTGFANDERFFN